MAKQIFLSYGREEEVQSFVKQLKHDLERSGFTVWLDIEDIPAGSNWRAAIGSALHNCKGLIAVITNKYINSHYCTNELNTVDTGRKDIFPVIFEDVNFEQSEKSMGVKFVVSGINWSFFRPEKDNYDESLQKLMQGMTEHGIEPNAVENTDALVLNNTSVKVQVGQKRKDRSVDQEVNKEADEKTEENTKRTKWETPKESSHDSASLPSSSTTVLAIKDLDDVQSELPDFSDWNKLGLKLKIHPNKLELVKKNDTDISARVSEVLKLWLKQEYMEPEKCGLPTWNQLAKAVEAVDRALAETIRKNRC